MLQLELPVPLILLMLMAMCLKQRQISHYADVVPQRRSHFAMAVIAIVDLLASNYLAA